MPVNFMALTKYATGFHTDEKKRKRQELDDRPSYDPWQNEFKTAFNSDAQVNHPCPSHDTLGLAYADPNNCIVGWSGDQLKGFCSKIRSQISLVMVDWTASGNNDVDTLENFCEPSTDKGGICRLRRSVCGFASYRLSTNLLLVAFCAQSRIQQPSSSLALLLPHLQRRGSPQTQFPPPLSSLMKRKRRWSRPRATSRPKLRVSCLLTSLHANS